jgi:flagellin-like hook-associated protein FlgL
MFSINTNLSAMAALISLQDTQNSLSTTQNAVSTGLKVGSAADNPAIYAISQTMDATVAGLTAVSDGLSFGAQVISTATQAVENISSQLATLQNTITEGQNQGISATEINTQITNQLTNINSFATASTFNGVNLISGSVNSVVTANKLTILQDTSGNSFTVGGSGPNVFNATSAGLGLTGLNVNSAGLNIDLTGLTPSAIVNSGQSDTSLTLQTANYNSSASETATNVGKQWVFEFSSATSTLDTTDSLATTPLPQSSGNIVNVEATDSNGNITQQTTVVKVSLGANFTTTDAINALQAALSATGFSAELNPTGTLTVTGNNLNATTGPNGTVSGSAALTSVNYQTNAANTGGTTTIALNTVAGLSIGQQVQAPAIDANSGLPPSGGTTPVYITAIDTDNNTITLSQSTGTSGIAVSTPVTFGPIYNGSVAQQTATGSQTVQLTSVAGLQLGQTITDATNAAALPSAAPLAVITNINAATNTITLSTPTTALVQQGDNFIFGTPQFVAADAAPVSATSLTLASTAGLAVGDQLTYLNGTALTTPPTITSIDGNTVKLSAGVPSAVATNNYMSFGPPVIQTASSFAAAPFTVPSTLQLANVTGLQIGQVVSDSTSNSTPGQGAIPPNTVISAIDAATNTITLSQSLTAGISAGSPDSLTITAVPSANSTLINQITGSTVVLQALNAALAKVNAISTTLGSASQEITGLQGYDSSLSDSLTAGVGALIDADMAAESAQLTSLQTKESLAIQALSIANARPQALLTLFR